VAVAAVDTVPKVGDHRVTGAVIGGVLGGVIGYVAAAGIYGGGDCTTSVPAWCPEEKTLEKALVTVGGAAIGAGLGYLAGKSTPKGSLPNTPPPGASPEDTGLTPAQGAGIGALIGGLAFAYLGSVGDGGDGEPPIVGISLGVLIGAFIGGGLARE
jgi:hypothetical protein